MKTIVGCVCGLLGGFLGGLIGIGGGIIMVPLMLVLARITQHQAHGTSLVAIVFTGLIGAGTYYSHGTVDWKAGSLLALTAIVTARFGALFAHSLQENRLRKAFGAFVLTISLMVVLSPCLGVSHHELSTPVYVVALLLTGAFTGFLSGMMGVGGGAIMVPAMVVVAGMPQHLAQGTSLLAMVPASLMGAFTHYRLGNVQTRIAWGLAAGSILGTYLGATMANSIQEHHLRLFFAAVGVCLGLRYILSSSPKPAGKKADSGQRPGEPTR